MARALEYMQKSRSFHLKRMLEAPARHARSFIFDVDDSPGPKNAADRPLELPTGAPPPIPQPSSSASASASAPAPAPAPAAASHYSAQSSSNSSFNSRSSPSHTEEEQIKERFAKLLLGEDMSGRGMGVSSALALSNAITNLAASVFGEQGKLEPMSAERKALWRKELDLLLSVADYIVELVPCQQTRDDGTVMEVMVTQQRRDLHVNIPALRKLDAMLLEYLDNFKGPNEFWYVSRNSDDAGTREDDKWWRPTPKVPPNGLSETFRKWLQFQKESVNQVLKAAMAINAQLLSEMEIPEDYIESLPKNGRSSLGDSIYKSITVEFFDPEQLLSTMDLSTEHKVLEFKNKIEASIVIWRRKMNHKDGKSAWGSAVSLEKRELFEERAETILLLLKQRFPGLPQSQLEISKIQFNQNVGQSIIEGYSRIIETLAFTVMSRIEDVMYADSLTQNPPLAHRRRKSSADCLQFAIPIGEEPPQKNPTETPKKNPMDHPLTPTGAGTAMTLSDFMGWNLTADNEPGSSSTDDFKVITHKKSFSYME